MEYPQKYRPTNLVSGENIENSRVNDGIPLCCMTDEPRRRMSRNESCYRGGFGCKKAYVFLAQEGASFSKECVLIHVISAVRLAVSWTSKLVGKEDFEDCNSHVFK